MTARAGRAAVPARVPREEIEIGQVELGGQMIHAARVLVAAVKDHDRAARLPRRRRPMAIEERDVVVRLERVLGGRARARGGERSAGGVNRSFIARPPVAAATPRRTRRTTLQPIRSASAGISQKAMSGSVPPSADVEAEGAEHERAVALAHRAVVAPRRSHHRAERPGHFRDARRRRSRARPTRGRTARRRRTADRARRRRRRRRAR